jgi:hypothetical protein
MLPRRNDDDKGSISNTENETQLELLTIFFLLLLIDGSGERRPEPRHGRVSRGVTPDDFGTLETWCATPTKAT